MDKYLKQLLEQYAKVILPSFGAIVVENEETGNLMFNEYLSYNDGKLDDLIVSESNMELQEAQNMIAKYIRDIQVQIDKGESYDIFELGRFYKNEDGDIEFEGNLKNGPSSESKKEPSKVAAKDTPEDKKETPKEESKPKESKSSTKKEEPKEDKKTETKEKKEDKKEVKSEKKSTKKENKYVAKQDETKSKGKSESESEKENESEKQSESLGKKVKKTPKKDKAKVSVKKKKDKKPKEGEKKKRFGAFFWIIVIILALASAGFIYVGLNYEKVKSYMGWDQFEGEDKVVSTETKEQSGDTNSKDSETETGSIESDENNVPDTSETTNVEFDEEGNIAEEDKKEVESETKNQVEPEPEPEPQPISTASNGTHHLIAGSFSDKSNAEGLVQELKSKGLDARILGQFGGLHFVAAASYNSSKAARDDIERVKQHASGVWIFKYNDN